MDDDLEVSKNKKLTMGVVRVHVRRVLMFVCVCVYMCVCVCVHACVCICDACENHQWYTQF